MRATSKYVLAIVIGVGGLFASLVAINTLPDGELWFITLVLSMFAYMACAKLGWMALVLIPFFPFLIFMLEMDQENSERYSFGIAVAAWSIFAIAAIVGAWRWWKRLRNTAPGTQ